MRVVGLGRRRACALLRPARCLVGSGVVVMFDTTCTLSRLDVPSPLCLRSTTARTWLGDTHSPPCLVRGDMLCERGEVPLAVSAETRDAVAVLLVTHYVHLLAVSRRVHQGAFGTAQNACFA